MKVTGNDLISAVEQHKFRLETLKQEFTDSLHAFDGESKREPTTVMSDVQAEERAIAVLQAAQSTVNGAVRVIVTGKGVSEENLTLAEAIKLVGGIERVHAMWKSAAVEKADPYSYRSELVRDPTQVRAQRKLDNKVAAEHAAQTKLYQRALRAAIVTGNRQAVELNLEPSLLD